MLIYLWDKTLGVFDDLGSLSRTEFTYKDDPYTIAGLAYFPDETPPYLSLGLEPDGGTVFNDDARFTLSLGATDLSFGSDPFEHGLFIWENPGLSWSDGDTVPVKLTRTNTAPTAAPATVRTNEDTRYAFGAGDFNFSDTADSDDTLASVKITALPAAGTLSVDGTAVVPADLPKAVSRADIDAGKLTYTPVPDANGSATFNFKVNDGYVDSASDSLMTVTITAVNDAPVLEKAMPNRSAAVGAAFSYQFPQDTFGDVDGDTLTYTATRADGTARPMWLSFAADTRTFSGMPTTAVLGVVSVRVTASDGQLSASDQFDITVQAGTPPALTGATVVTNGRSIILQFDEAYAVPNSSAQRVRFFNTLAGALSVTAGGAAVGFDLSPPSAADLAARRLTLTNVSPTVAQGQSVVVAYTDPTSGPDDVAIEDAAGNETGTFTTGLDGVAAVTNNSTFVNTGPTVATAIPDQRTVAGTAFSYRFPANTFSDANRDALTYAATRAAGTALPAWLSFDAATRLFSGTPQDGDVGRVSVKVTARDVYGAPVSDTFLIRVIRPDVHCNPSDPLEYWCASLEVGSLAGGAFGYASDGGWLSRPPEFTYKGVTYTIDQLSNSTTPGLTLALDPDGNTVFNKDDPPVAGFALRIGTTDFVFTDSTFGSGSFSWSNPGLSWSADDTVPVKIIRANQPIRVRDIEFSDPGPDELYTHGEELEIAVTFSEPLNIPGAVIHLPNYFCVVDGISWAKVDRGHGTNRIVFGCTVAHGPHTRVHVGANRLRPGTSGDGSRVSELHPAAEKTTAVHGLAGPRITGVSLGVPKADGLWTDGETLKIYYTFSEPVTVATDSGTPTVSVRHIFVDPRNSSLEKAEFRRVEDGNTLVFSQTVHGRPRKAFELPRDALSANWGVIAGTGDGALADLSHAVYDLESPCGKLPDELWCTIMRVGRDGANYGYELNHFGFAQPSFMYRTAFIYVTGLHLRSGNKVFFFISDDSDSGQLPPDGILGPGRFTLEIGTGADRRSFAIVDPGDKREFEFPNPGLSWSVGDLFVVRLRGPAASEQRVEVEPPSVADTPALSPAGPDGQWTEGETVEVTLAFSEEVEVGIDNGTPSVGIELGGTQARQAAYVRGSGTEQLVFAYTLVTGDGDHGVMAVTPDSLALHGGTIQSASSGVAASLSHEGAAVLAQPAQQGTPKGEGEGRNAGFTARFGSLPAHHDGATAFTFELHFSEAPEYASLSYRTVQGGLLEVTGADVTRARRLTAGSNLAWEVTAEPTQGGDIAIRLPVRACTETNAVCANGQALARAVSATVPRARVPLTASFSNAPAEHDGTNAFEIRFGLSTEPAEVSYVTVRDSLFTVTGGTIENASRLVGGRNRGWKLKVAPSGQGDVMLTLKATTSCDTLPGICTTDGRMLGGGLSVTVRGPVTLSVADAEVDEAEDASLDFTVTLSRRRGAAVTVDYATSDGTATAGLDYTATSGTLSFAAGETGKTVSVPVLDDAHDEGSETMTFTLSNASGAVIEDGEARGTINNTDAMPKAWIARFGRTVAEQVLGAVEGRLEAPREAGVEASLAGQSIAGAGSPEEALERREAETAMTAFAGWLGGETSEEEGVRGLESRAVSERDLLLGSSFALTGGSAETGFAALWGRAAVSGFDGRDGDLTVDGEVTSALLGADWSGGRATAGLALAQSRGEGSYRSPGGDGEAESTLTGVYPYGRYAISERVSVWGVAGLGRGSLTLKPGNGTRIETDMELAMGALGLRGVLVEAPAEGGMELAAKTDGMMVRTSSDAASGTGGNIAAAEADVTRLRLGLQATWHGVAAGGGTLTPSVEIGVRHDGGDAETGYGADIGAGLSWVDPVRGISADIRARGLLAHEADGFSERGFSGTLSWDPEPSTALGPSLSLTQTLGAAASGGSDALLRRGTMEGLAASEGGDELERRRMEAKLGYGFALFGGAYTGTPELGLGLSDAHRDYSLGWRLAEVRRAGLAFGLDIEGTRRERADGEDEPEHGLGLGLGWRLEGAGAGSFELRFEGARLDAANDGREHRARVRMTARW